MSLNDPPFPDWYLALNKGPTIVGVITWMTALATVFIAARVFVKGWMLRNFSVDDGVLVVSLIFGWLAVAASIVAVKSGDGRHIEGLNENQISGAIFVSDYHRLGTLTPSVQKIPAQAKQSLQWTMVGFFPSILSISIPKFAVVMLLIKFLNPTNAHQIFLWVMVTISGLCMCGCMVILWSQCTPTRAQWEIELQKECWDVWILINYSRTASALAGVTDLYLAVYPAVILYSLQLHWKKKAALSSALGIGVVAAITAWYKASTLVGLATHDFTWDTCDLTMWTCIEGSTIIIAACIPLLQPLLELILGRRTLSSSDKTSGQRNAKHGEQNDEYGSKNNGGHATELSSYSRHGRSRRKGKSDIDTAILHTHIDGESQESILNGAGRAIQQRPVMNGPETDGLRPRIQEGSKEAGPLQKSASHGHRPSDQSDQSSPGILRTHEVRVEYGVNEMAFDGKSNAFHPSQWKAV